MRLLATAAAFFALAGTAHAARTDDFAKPVLFIPAAQDCGVYDDMLGHLAEYSTSVGGVKIGMTGTMDAVGLYGGASGCSADLGGARGASVAQLGTKLAAYIAAKQQVVDVVAEGQAGLVVRAALAQDKTLRVEDVVTLGTPHGGSDLPRNPQGAGGTDWSVIASDGDTTVPVASAIDLDAAHKTVYKAGSHADLLTDVSDAMDAKIRYSHNAGKWVEWNNAPHPVNRVAENLIFGGGETTGACGLRETQPELCGKTPVILVPGFGASELECQSGGVKINTWPWALFEGSFWLRMSLASDGRSPGDPGNQCSRTVAPTGKAIDAILNLPIKGNTIKIHESSHRWIERIAPGHGYVFGWDFRKGPDQTVGRLDKYIDELRARHGVSKVALVAHSYGGLLSRWYVDDDARARKVARVANFGSPFWGAPKAWFAMAYGYESPMDSDMDNLTPNDTFKYFAKNLTGLYYLLPPQAWFDHAPNALKYWLSVDDQWVRSPAQVADQIRAFKGNGALANEVAAFQAKHVSGFKRTNGVDWRIFVGSGLASLGHVRAYSGSDNVQYSWINGDGTVPLISQRQAATSAGPQLGDRTPTYHFCEIPHMEEMERELIQDQVTPFVVDGADPVKGGNGLRSEPCPLSETEFKVTGKEDAQSLSLSRVAEAALSSARAAQAPPERLSLTDAETEGLVEVIRHDGHVTFVPNVPVVVHAAGSGTLQTTPLRGEGTRGTPVVYDIPAGGMEVTAQGTQAVAVATGGGVLKGRKADTAPPRTKVKVRRSGRSRILTATAKDATGVAVTMVQVGKARPKPWKKRLKVSKRATVRYWSVDTLGNAERHRKVKLR